MEAAIQTVMNNYATLTNQMMEIFNAVKEMATKVTDTEKKFETRNAQMVTDWTEYKTNMLNNLAEYNGKPQKQ